jgi:hypothetical protein
MIIRSLLGAKRLTTSECSMTTAQEAKQLRTEPGGPSDHDTVSWEMKVFILHQR